jgi:hypothetical protein
VYIFIYVYIIWNVSEENNERSKIFTSYDRRAKYECTLKNIQSLGKKGVTIYSGAIMIKFLSSSDTCLSWEEL